MKRSRHALYIILFVFGTCSSLLLPPAEPGRAQSPPAVGCTPIEGQIILMGAASKIDALLANLPPIILTQRDRVDMDWIAQVNPLFTAPLLDPLDLTEAEARLYEIGSTHTITEVLDTIGTTPQSDDVLASPNCMTLGSSRARKGSPYAAVIVDTPLSTAAFLGQPALQAAPGGIGLYEGSRRLVTQTGAGCNVVILDNSPYQDVPEDGRSVPRQIRLPADGAAQVDVSFKVIHFPMPEIESVEGDVLVADHGLVIASLVHAVSPQSKIFLYRVLNERALGDLFTVLKAVNHYANDRDNNQKCTVFNLSLGLGADAALPYTDNPLYTTLNAIIGLNAVVVASAGNDSFDDSLPPRPAQEPASYPRVISVAARTIEATPSCFSNQGEVAAPGGQAVPLDNKPCEQVSDTDALIGPSYVAGDPNMFHTAKVVGTSVAAPLVAGMAALIKAQENCQIRPEAVERLIRIPEAEMIHVPTIINYPELDIQLEPGWNLLGLPLLAEQMPVDDALSELSLDGSYTTVCAYNATLSNPWQCYVPAVQGGSLQTIGPTDGLWIYISRPGGAKVTLRGRYPRQSQRPLVEGWNLVSFAVSTPRALAKVLPNETVESVWTYEARQHIWQVSPPRADSSLLTEIRPGKAYWIYVSQDDEINYTN